MTIKAPAITEAQFMTQVTELARWCGWTWLHLRPGMTRDSWRTPISGPLGKGWPDLILVRARDARLIFAELKRDGATLSPEQMTVLGTLAHLSSANRPHFDRHDIPFTQVFVWHPADWPEIEAELR